jgi:hypothetical protein
MAVQRRQMRRRRRRGKRRMCVGTHDEGFDDVIAPCANKQRERKGERERGSVLI